MDRQARGLPFSPADYFFATTTGRRRETNPFRDRILGRALARANPNRADAGLPALPEITPHSLRRTWATFACPDPSWIAAQIGAHQPVLYVLGLPAGGDPPVHR
jgi:integrase